jgi:hypothetical protein
MNNTTDYFSGEMYSPKLVNLLDTDLGLDALSLFVLLMILFYVLALLSKNERWKRILLHQLGVHSTACGNENDEHF